MDHCGIYLLIAGSFTPFGLLVLEGTTLGTGLLVAIWTLAICGIASKLLLGNRFTSIAVVSYVVMGWLGVLGIQPIFAALGIVAASLAVAGGIPTRSALSFSPGIDCRTTTRFSRIRFAWQHSPLHRGHILRKAYVVTHFNEPRHSFH